MQEPLSDCFTCLRKTDNFLRICDESNTEPVDQILAKHFWFNRTDFEWSVLCTSCWEKIDEFHKFYCDVANLHHTGILQHVQIKEDPDDKNEVFLEDESGAIVVRKQEVAVKGKRGRKRKRQPDDEDWKQSDSNESVNDQLAFPIPVQVKVEILDQGHPCEAFDSMTQQEEIKLKSDEETDESSSDDESDDDEDESDEESSKPIAARRQAVRRITTHRRTRRPAQIRTSTDKDTFISKHLDKLPCNQCNEVYSTFSQLEKHCKNVHDSSAIVVCCNRQYQKQVGLYNHLCRHKNIYKFHCKECDRCFKNGDGLSMHNLLHHTPEEDKKFRCNLCERAFATETFLTSHLNWHATVEPKNIVCQKCNKYFTNTKMLENHTKTHHPEILLPDGYPAEADGMYDLQHAADAVGSESLNIPASAEGETGEASIKKPQELAKPIRRKTPEELAREDDLIRKYCALNCEQCDFSGETFSKLELHYKNVHDARGYASCCGRKFGKKSRLYEHVCVHENPEHFKCETCAKTFQNSFGLANHMMWKHTPDSEKPFRCDVCGNRFWKDYLLKQHMEYHLALEEKKYACKECDRYFGTNLLLKSHEQTVHGLSASWVCDICAKGFPLKSALEFHRQQHTQEGRAALKAQCQHCKLWLKNIRSLRSHLKRCTSEPVSCDLCGKECSNVYALQGHKKFVHQNNTMYSCSFCAKPFKRLLRLKEHEAGHTGDLLYKCEYCPRTCNSSSNMYTHKKVAHPEQWAEKMAHRFHQR